MSYTIRNLQSYDDMVAVKRVQREVWGFDESDMGLYPPMLLTAAKNGGVVLGAFDDESGEMIAFLFGFLGRESGRPLKLCSQNMGVKKEWRKHGIAETLKHIQREFVITQGLPLITWTFDPLEGPNAHLNLRKLRAISRSYWRDVYGSNFGSLNAGLPSDRLVVEWWVNGPRLEAEPDENYEEEIWDSPAIFETQGEGATRWIVKANLGLDSEFALLETPADIHPVKEANLELALDWRLKVRKAFETYFGKGYIAVDFVSVIERGERRNRYVLQKNSAELTAEIGIE